MTVTVRVPGPLRRFCGDASTIEVDGDTVGDVVAALPSGIVLSVLDEQGQVRRHVNVFVNEDNVRQREGLATALTAGDEVSILPAVSGGDDA